MIPSIKTLHIHVKFYDGEDEDDVGYPYYVASCREIMVVVEGRTLNELFRKLREVIKRALADEETIATYNVVPNPRINIIMDLPEYAQIV